MAVTVALKGGALLAETLKKKVIDNCPEALAGMQALNPDQQKEFAAYLQLVLELHSRTANVSALAPEQIGPVVMDPQALGDWAFFDPNRDIEAKRCATELLQSLGSSAVEAIGTLTQTSRDHLLPMELRDKMKETAFELAVKAAGAGAAPSEKVLAQLFEMAVKDDFWLAQNILFELQGFSLSYLIDKLPVVPAEQFERFSDLMLFIDRRGQIIAERLFELSLSDEEETALRAVRVLSRMRAVYPDLFGFIVNHLGESSGAKRGALIQALKLVCDHQDLKEALSADQEMLRALFNALKGAPIQERDIIEKAAADFGLHNPQLKVEALALAKEDEADLRARGLRLLGQSGDQSLQTFNILESSLNDQVLTVRLNAIQALSFQNSRIGDVLAVFERMLRNSAAKRDPRIEKAVLLSFAAAFERLDPGRAGIFVAPYLVEALSFTEEEYSAVQRHWPVQIRQASRAAKKSSHPAVSALLSLGVDAVPLLVRAARSPDAGLRQRAAFILGRIKPVQREALSSLVDLLRDENIQVREQAQESLFSLGREAVHEVRRSLRRGPVEARLAAAQVLVNLGDKDEHLADIFKEAIFQEDTSQEACRQKGRALLFLARIESGVADSAARKVFECLKEYKDLSGALIESLAQAGPLSEKLLSELADFLVSAHKQPELQIKLLGRIGTFGFADSELASLLLTLLEQGQDSVSYVVLKNLAEAAKGSDKAKSKLEDLIRLQSGNAGLLSEVILALISIDAGAFDVNAYVLSKLRSGDLEALRTLLPRLKPETAVALCQAAFNGNQKESIPEEGQALLLKFCGDLGDSSVRFALMWLELLQSGSSLVRQHALLALFKTAPHTPQLVEALRKALVGEEFKSLKEQGLPAGALPVLKAVIAEPASRLERHNAEELKTSHL